MIDNHAYAKIPFQLLNTLDIGDQVFVTYHSENETQFRTSAIVWNKSVKKTDDNNDSIHITNLLVAHGNNQGTLLSVRHYLSGNTRCSISPFGTNAFKRDAAVKLSADEICIEQRISMLVKTPHGLLRATDKCDDEYPGFWIELPETERCTTLAMVEYISGGEGTCDFDPANGLTEMRRQDNEVPPERRTRNPNVPDDAEWYNKHQLTEGFVTRAWADEDHNEEHHYRTFHFGYKHPEEPNEEDTNK